MVDRSILLRKMRKHAKTFSSAISPSKVIDKATTLTSTVCTYGPVFTYNYSVLNSINFIPNSFVKKLRTQWCTNPQFADLINGFKKIEL